VSSRKTKDIEDFINNDPSFKQRGTFVGTPLYVAPEMLKSNESSAATDLWALGCIIYQMLVGKVPFQAKTDIETFNLILKGTITYP
jgi:3-phosphoinositide dependent protein kinase-1